jgi:hypothetical protein
LYRKWQSFFAFISPAKGFKDGIGFAGLNANAGITDIKWAEMRILNYRQVGVVQIRFFFLILST